MKTDTIELIDTLLGQTDHHFEANKLNQIKIWLQTLPNDGSIYDLPIESISNWSKSTKESFFNAQLFKLGQIVRLTQIEVYRILGKKNAGSKRSQVNSFLKSHGLWYNMSVKNYKRDVDIKTEFFSKYITLAKMQSIDHDQFNSEVNDVVLSDFQHLIWKPELDLNQLFVPEFLSILASYNECLLDGRLSRAKIHIQLINYHWNIKHLENFSDTYNNPLLEKKLEHFDLSDRVLNVLRVMEIETLIELLSHNKSDLINYRVIGNKSLAELEKLLDELGLNFGFPFNS